MSATLDHVNVVVSDIERSRDFYTRLLDLRPVMDRMLDGPWFEALTGIDAARARCVILDAKDGGCRVELLRFEPKGADFADGAHPATAGLRHFALRVADLEACLSRLDAAPPVVEVPREIVPVGKRMAYVVDPDGAIVELAEYGGEPAFAAPVPVSAPSPP